MQIAIDEIRCNDPLELSEMVYLYEDRYLSLLKLSDSYRSSLYIHSSERQKLLDDSKRGVINLATHESNPSLQEISMFMCGRVTTISVGRSEEIYE